jgi:hypothetical protein
MNNIIIIIINQLINFKKIGRDPYSATNPYGSLFRIIALSSEPSATPEF